MTQCSFLVNHLLNISPTLSLAIPNVRLEALHMSGVDDMSTQDVFGYFKEYPPAHIEWIDDTSCKYSLTDITTLSQLCTECIEIWIGNM